MPATIESYYARFMKGYYGWRACRCLRKIEGLSDLLDSAKRELLGLKKSIESEEEIGDEPCLGILVEMYGNWAVELESRKEQFSCLLKRRRAFKKVY